EMDRLEVISDTGETYTICQFLRITRITYPGQSIGSRIKPYWQTQSGFRVEKKSDTEFRVWQGDECIVVHPLNLAASTLDA
ncbi:MAG TPA: hypothetical protein VFG20_20580, partial [Planctomycetaceae bacterium]|nr:hypothetical protein [Planctomycetaceae bacterium]